MILKRKLVVSIILSRKAIKTQNNKEKVIDAIWNSDTLIRNGLSKDEEQKHVYYSRYNWLHWIKENCNESELIESKLEEIIEIYPDFLPRKNPDLIIGPITTKWGSDSPVSSEELYSMTITDLIPFIVNYKGDSFSGPDRFGLMDTISSVAQMDYKWGMRVIEELSSNEIWEKDIWEAVLQGVANSINTKKQFYYVLKEIEPEALKNRASSIAFFFSRVLDNESVYKDLTKNSALLIGEKVKTMWDYRLNDNHEYRDFDWITKSINNTTGILTVILMRLTLLYEDTVPKWIKSFIEKNVEKANDNEEAVCIICGFSAHLFYMDATWTIEHVLRFLKSDNKSIKTAAWEGFLHLVNSLSVEFGKELLPIFYDEIEIIKELDNDYMKAFIHDYALLIVYLEDDPIEQYISKLLNSIQYADRKFFAISINTILKSMDSIAREDLWSRWLKKYWELRNINIPIKLGSDEYVEMLEWLLLLKDFKNNINIAMGSDVTQIDINPFLYELSESSVLSDYPEESADLLIFLLSKTGGQVDVYTLGIVINKLESFGIPERKRIGLKGYII